MKKIDHRFKILYAIGIILVVSTHCDNGGLNLFIDWFEPFSFHLGLFAFASGYFYKDKSADQAGSYILRKVRHLLVPLYLWNLFYGILCLILSRQGFAFLPGQITLRNLMLHPITSGHQFQLNMGGWFMVPLFMVEVFNVLFRKLVAPASRRAEIVCFCLYLCIGFCGVHMASIGLNTGWWLVLVRMLYFVPFYGLGIFYNRILEPYDRKIRNLYYFSAIFLIRLALSFLYMKPLTYTPSWCNNFVDGPVIPFLVGFLGIAFWLRVSAILTPAIGKSPAVNLIADNTYAITIHHFLGFLLLKLSFAACAKWLHIFGDFSLAACKESLWYYYLPRGLQVMMILYLAAGIAVPIGIQFLTSKAASSLAAVCRRKER